MADVQLQRPAAGQRVVVTNWADGRLVMAFALDEARVERTGDDMVLDFDDGSSLVLCNFYTQYAKIPLLEFEIQGKCISGVQFFTALEENLMPAGVREAIAGAAVHSGRFSGNYEAKLMGSGESLGVLGGSLKKSGSVIGNLNSLDDLTCATDVAAVPGATPEISGTDTASPVVTPEELGKEFESDMFLDDGDIYGATQIADRLHDMGVLDTDLNFTAGANLDDSVLALGNALRGMSPDQLQDFANWAECHVENAQDGTDAVFDESGTDVLWDQDSSDTLHEKGGNGILIGGSGDDLLYGDTNSDFLLGGADDNSHNGSTASNQFYGGEGNHILVCTRNSPMINGGVGVDFFVGVDNNFLDKLFSLDNPRPNIEVVVMGQTDGVKNLTDLGNMGITVQGDKVQLGNGWHAAEDFHTGGGMELPCDYKAFTNNQDMTIIVQRNALENGQT